MNLNDMKPAELRAAMKGGTTAWGVIGSAAEHVRYKLALPKIRARRQCHCGCGTKATHAKMANGVMLGSGCELSVQRWVKDAANSIAKGGAA